MEELLFQVKESLDGGYEAYSVGYSIYTQCEKYEEIKNNVREAVLYHFEEAELPKIIRIQLVKEEIIAL